MDSIGWIYRGLSFGLITWHSVSNTTFYILKSAHAEEPPHSLSLSPMHVYVSVGARACARAPWWQPLDRSKAAMMNRHLALGSALAQWAVNLPLPLSARRMLNKVIWIFVILMWLHVKAHWSLTVRENMRRFILPCRPMGRLWWGIPANARLNKSESWIVH